MRLPGEESAEDLIAAAEAAGAGAVTKDQLTRWHRAGLLPRPRQVSRGRAGSVVFYPPGTSAQLLDLLGLKTRNRKLAVIRWGLWWKGYDIADHWAREFLESFVRSNIKTRGELVEADGTLTNKAHDALDKVPDVKLDSGAIRRARRRVGTDEIDQFLQDLLLVTTGNVDMLKDEDLARLERGMALDRARKDPVASLGGPWLTTDRRGDFEDIAQHADFEHQLAVIDATSNDSLRAARDQAKAIMPVISNVGAVFRQTLDASALGYGSFGRLFDELADNPGGQAYILITLLSVADAGHDEGIANIVTLKDQADKLPVQYEILVALRDEIPELAPVISDKRLGAAQQDAGKAARLAADIAAARAEFGDEMDAFFARHPEYHAFLR